MHTELDHTSCLTILCGESGLSICKSGCSQSALKNSLS